MMPLQNDDQYTVTKKQVEKFQAALETLKQPQPGVPPAIQKIKREAIESVMVELQEQMKEYEARVKRQV